MKRIMVEVHKVFCFYANTALFTFVLIVYIAVK